MSGTISLRNISPQALHMAHCLCEQTEQSMADILRQAIVSGLLVEATKYAPDLDGKLAGLEAIHLAKALRRHISSAIDVLLEHEEHPYQIQGDKKNYTPPSLEKQAQIAPVSQAGILFEATIGDDLDMLGLGLRLSETTERNA